MTKPVCDAMISQSKGAFRSEKCLSLFEVQKSKDPFYEVVGNVQQYEDQFLDNLLTVNENEEGLEFSENEDEERDR